MSYCFRCGEAVTAVNFAVRDPIIPCLVVWDVFWHPQLPFPPCCFPSVGFICWWWCCVDGIELHHILCWGWHGPSGSYYFSLPLKLIVGELLFLSLARPAQDIALHVVTSCGLYSHSLWVVIVIFLAIKNISVQHNKHEPNLLWCMLLIIHRICITETYNKYLLCITGTSSSNSSENQTTSWDLWWCCHGLGVSPCFWWTLWSSRWVSWRSDFRQVNL